MKKIARNIIIAVLVLSLTLGIFAGCQKEPEDKRTFSEKYGITMSDKTVTYDGEKHSFGIAIDNTILQGKAYEVTYECNGVVLTKVEFTDVGEYSVTAKIKVADDETVYPLTNKFTIKKAPLDLEVGNLFLRQGQGMATLGNPRELFKDAAYIGKDTNAILGTLSFEIYNGNTKVNDVSTLKPSASVATPYKVKIVGIKDLANYEIKLGEGKLYVMIDAEYDNAKSLKEEIASVPTSTTINTYDFFKMREFASAADHILTTYPSTSEIQRLMCGTIDVNVVKALKKTADNRIATVYDFEKDIETAVGEIKFLGAQHVRNDKRTEDRITEFKNSVGAKSKVEYQDSIAFEVIIYDTVKYQFTNVLINGVEFYRDSETPGVVTDNAKTGANTITYKFGTVNATFVDVDKDGYGYSADKNPGVASGGVQISNKLLGALDGKTTLTITPVVGQVFDAGVYKGSATTETTKDNMATEYPELSNMTITSKGSTDYDLASGKTTSQLVLGKEYKFTISTLTGYGIVSVEVGDKLVLASQMDNGSFTLKLTEDNISPISKIEVVKIIPTFEKVYSFAVKADTSGDPRTLSNSNKDGVFTSNAGTIKLGGVSSTNVPTIGEEKIVNLSVKPDSGWLIKEVVVYQGTLSSTAVKVDITADFEGATVVPLDLSERRFKDKLFDSKNEVNVIVKFRESYPIVVKATHGDKTVNMTYSAASGQFTSKFGTVEVLKSKNEQMSVISREGAYCLKLEKVDGYVPKKISINGKPVVSDGAGNYNEGIRYAMIRDTNAKALVLNNTINSSDTKANVYNMCVEAANSYDPTKMLIFDEKLSPGSECVIEIEYAAYYYIELSKSGTANTACEVEFGTYLTGSGDTFTVSTEPEKNINKVAKGINLTYVANRCIINVNNESFYCYDETNNFYARIMATTEEHTGGTTKKLIDPKIIIGCTGDYWITSSNAHPLRTSVNEAVTLPTKPLDSKIAKLVSSKPILPGGTISIMFEASGYDSK